MYIIVTPPTPPSEPEDNSELSGPLPTIVDVVEPTISDNGTSITQQSAVSSVQVGSSASATAVSPSNLPPFEQVALLAALSRLKATERDSSEPTAANNPAADVIEEWLRIATQRATESQATKSATTESRDISNIALPLANEAAAVTVIGRWKSNTIMTPDPAVMGPGPWVEDQKKDASLLAKVSNFLPLKQKKKIDPPLSTSKSPAVFRRKSSSETNPSHPVPRNCNAINDSTSRQSINVANCSSSEPVISANHLVEMKTSADFKIFCGNTIFPVHKSILANSSRFFANLLKDGTDVSNQGIARYDDIEPNVMKQVLSFIYLGKHSIPLDVLNRAMASRLLLVADKFVLPDLSLLAQDVLSASLTIANVCSILELAHGCCAKHLKEQAIRFILGSWREVRSRQEWSDLTSRFPVLAAEVKWHKQTASSLK